MSLERRSILVREAMQPYEDEYGDDAHRCMFMGVPDTELTREELLIAFRFAVAHERREAEFHQRALELSHDLGRRSWYRS